MRECREQSKRQASEILLLRQNISALQAEKESLCAQIRYRDEYLEKHNIVLPFIGPDGELVETKARNFADLLKDKEDELEGNILSYELCYIRIIFLRTLASMAAVPITFIFARKYNQCSKHLHTIPTNASCHA